jgi:uncharacterized membrane protein
LAAQPLNNLAAPLAPAARLSRAVGWRVYGLGFIAMGLAGLVWGDFITGQSVPNNFAHRIALAYTAAAFLFLAGAALQWRSAIAIASASVVGYYTLIVLLLMNGPVLLAHFKEYGSYESLAAQIAITTGAVILFASYGHSSHAVSFRLIRFAQRTFGLCALVWGGAHFVYMNLTAPLIPQWLPPSQVFWGYLTGACFIIAGLAILTRIRARLAALLLTVMLASFTFLVHIRILFTDHKSQWNWTELAINLAIVGTAWVVTDSLRTTNA